MKSLLWIACLLASQTIYGQRFLISDIPDSLLQNVNAVIREDHTQFQIISKTNASSFERAVITILNAKGNGYARKSIYYNKLIKVKRISAAVYDANGKLIRKLKASEIYDHAAFDGVSLYSDSRIREINLTQTGFPYTVEFETELEYDYLYSIPGTYFLSGDKASVQQVSYEISFPPSIAPRYKIIGIEDKVEKGRKPNGDEFLRWNYSSLKPLKPEPFAPDYQQLLPHIMLAPSQFEFEGYAGDMSSWEAYGKWQILLNQDRDILPVSTAQKVRELTSTITNKRDKIKALYHYLQNKTRYVGIQDGIGGLQPFPAKVVDEVGYGDCKGLSIYMIALLKEAGIKGYYTKILAGENRPEIFLDFPSHQTNHIIVSVPLEKDTVWLECTDQQNPFGYLGTFTDDRFAIMVTETGGKIVRTPKYQPAQNRQVRSAELRVEPNGNATAKVTTVYSGTQFENGNLNRVVDVHFEDQKKWVNENVDIPVFKVEDFSIHAEKKSIPIATVTLRLILDRYASVSGKRIFVTPNLMNRSTFVPTKVENRQYEVAWNSNYEDYDTVRIQIPETIYPEFVPKPVSIKSKFGEYSATYEFLNGEVIYIRTMKSWKGRYPKETYPELIDFYKNVSKADNTKLVFLSKT